MNNHFSQTLKIQYEYPYRDKIIQYTPHAFKHLDGWVPFGHPMWQYYSGMTITQSYKKSDIPPIYKQKLRKLCPYVQEMIDLALSGDGYDRISDPSKRKNYESKYDAYSYKINGIFMWVKFSEENPETFFISHICPLGVANPKLCSYRDPLPNVSEASWYGNYSADYTDIMPYSDITRQAFANICGGNEAVRGYAVCRDVYIESLQLRAIDTAAKEAARIAKEAADEHARSEAAKEQAAKDSKMAEERPERLRKEALEKAAAAEAAAAAAAEAKAAAEAAAEAALKEAAEADSPLKKSHFDELYTQLGRVVSPNRKAVINRLTKKMSYRRIPIPEIIPKNVHDVTLSKKAVKDIKQVLKPYRDDAGRRIRTRRALRARRRTRVV